jgi:hypothetical protein
MAKQKSTMPPNLLSIFDSVKNELIWIHAKWKIAQQLFDQGSERLELLSRVAPSFFRIMYFVYRDELFISICRLTDHSKRQSLNRLMKVLKSHINHQKYVDLVSLVEEINEKAIPITEWRNRKIAHNELVRDIEKGPEPLPEITKIAVNELLENMSRLMNEVEGHFSDSSTVYEAVILHGDGNNMAYILSEYEKMKINRIKELKRNAS